jgi:outer membrane protein assembly factor BamB
VFFYLGDAGLFAFDLTGRPVWSRKLGPFRTRNNWGTGGSPVLHGDRVYVLNDNDEQSFLAAFDKQTGTESL